MATTTTIARHFEVDKHQYCKFIREFHPFEKVKLNSKFHRGTEVPIPKDNPMFDNCALEYAVARAAMERLTNTEYDVDGRMY